MAKRKGSRASDKFMRLLTANVLGNIGKQLNGTPGLAAILDRTDATNSTKCENLIESASWTKHKESLDDKQLLALADAISSVESSSSWKWDETAELEQLVLNSQKEFERGGVSSGPADEWRAAAKDFEHRSYGELLIDRIVPAAELMKMAKQFQGVCDHAATELQSDRPAVSKPVDSAWVNGLGKRQLQSVRSLARFLLDRAGWESEDTVPLLAAFRLSAGEIKTQVGKELITRLKNSPAEVSQLLGVVTTNPAVVAS